MNARILLSVYGALVGIGGLIWLALPSQSLQLYGIATPDPIAVILARCAGAMAIGLGLIALLQRGVSASPAGRSTLVALTVANALSAAVCLHATLTAGLNALAWGPVVSYAVFAVLCGVALRAPRHDPVPLP